MVGSELKTFFAAADRRLSANMSDDKFDQIFVRSLLFLPGLVIPDVFFFISNHIARHLKPGRGTKTLFEQSVCNGLIVPAFRQPAEDFEQVREYLRRQGIYGLLPDDVTERVANRLSAAVEYRPVNHILWGRRFGESYDKLLSLTLENREKPQGREVTDVLPDWLWEHTEHLRQQAISEAREIEATRPGGFGVRRGEIINASARYLGLPVPEGGFSDSDDVLDALREMVGDQELRYLAASKFFDWLDEIYRINQARRLGTKPRLHNATESDLLILQPALEGSLDEYGIGPQRKSTAAASQGSQVADAFMVEMRIPNTRYLLDLAPYQLLALRDHGHDWRVAAQSYLESPTHERRHEAQECLESYERALCTNVPREELIDISIRAVAFGLGGMSFLAATDLMSQQLGTPPSSIFALAGAAGSLAYSRYRRRRKKMRITFAPEDIVIGST
jgi:hypothetical protein